MTGVQDDEREAAPGGRPRASRGRRGWTFWLGLGLVLAGLSVLGWIGWQLYGTNVVSQRRQQETVRQLEREWTQPGGGSAVSTDQGDATAILRVPRFGADFAVPILEGTDDDTLASGIGHVEGSAGAGEVGNFVVAGHRVTHGEPLRDMPALEKGDVVVVETRDVVYTYVLDTGGDDLRVPFTAGWVLDARPTNPEAGGVGPRAGEERLLTLTTCAELFHTDDRLVAFGHLRSATPR